MKRKRFSFKLEEDLLREEIIRHGAKRVLLQLPEGLKPEGPRLAAIIEGSGATAIVSGDPCYGACDLPLLEAKSLGVDLIVHYGHTVLVDDSVTRLPIVYLEARADVDVEAAVKKALKYLRPWSRIGLATTVQHIDKIDEVKNILCEAGKTVCVGKTGRTKYPGQVLGCDYSSAKSISDKVEAFLFIGGGRFHAIGLWLATMKPTIVADPFEDRAYILDDEAEKVLKRRWADISSAMKAKNFGVIIGLKPGQRNLEAAFEIKEALEKSGKAAVLLGLREITPQALMQFPTIDAYVNTACPRLSLDEPSPFNKPILTLQETYIVIGKNTWDDLLRRGVL
jgi:2-(3-amino-3-carboxypropyl)histidine synthase